MTAAEQWESAMYYARCRADWRALADRGGRPGQITRRQCLGHARYAEARIIDLAIRIEIELRRATP